MFSRTLLSIIVALCTVSSATAAYRSELVLQDEQLVGAVVKSKPPSPQDYDLPENYDLRSSGLLSSNLNQHIPVYCGRLVID